ncbi:BrnA antitoxin family protein [Methylibium sp.]|jgi:predicted DNA binding CopG/RHH family protein|uniref:BrnA antitoxin family protein n=1 Tax=Methylibium sp. TaxID=2067992 RepID=UPI003D100451
MHNDDPSLDQFDIATSTEPFLQDAGLRDEMDQATRQLDQALEDFDETILDRTDPVGSASSADMPPVPSCTSTRTTIRLPPDVLSAFRAEAARRGMPYQTLIIEILRHFARAGHRFTAISSSPI